MSWAFHCGNCGTRVTVSPGRDTKSALSQPPKAFSGLQAKSGPAVRFRATLEGAFCWLADQRRYSRDDIRIPRFPQEYWKRLRGTSFHSAHRSPRCRAFRRGWQNLRPRLPPETCQQNLAALSSRRIASKCRVSLAVGPIVKDAEVRRDCARPGPHTPLQPAAEVAEHRETDAYACACRDEKPQFRQLESFESGPSLPPRSGDHRGAGRVPAERSYLCHLGNLRRWSLDLRNLAAPDLAAPGSIWRWDRG